jgi:hypothetical protein
MLKKGDLLWGIILGLIVFFFIFPVTRAGYQVYYERAPFLMGFFKFFFLATMGELLSYRIFFSKWRFPSMIFLRAIIWGFLGMVITSAFIIYTEGVGASLAKGFLPGGSFNGMPRVILVAFYTSVIMNLTFGLFLMGFHRITDMYIDVSVMEGKWPSFSRVIHQIQWDEFVSFVVFKTIPFFWIPAHTITFSLPVNVRVLTAAFLSIALGGILAFAKKGALKQSEVMIEK